MISFHGQQRQTVDQHSMTERSLRRNATLFDAFHAENSVGGRLEVTQVYEVNHGALGKWLASLEEFAAPAEIRQFARTFAKNLRNISFRELQQRLFSVAMEVIQMIERERPANVVLFIDGEVRKSNTWIALLLWPHIKAHVTHVTSDLDSLPPSLYENGRRLLILHPDDMSYSGTQMVDSMEFFVPRVAKLDPGLVYVPLLPFMGTAARSRLAEVSPNNVVILKATQIIGSLSDFLQADYDGETAGRILRLLRQEPWKHYYNVFPHHNLVYFDHKLADSVSIPTKMVVAGVAMNPATGETRTYRFIGNCEATFYKTEDGQILQPDKIFTDLDDEFTCPLAFYKWIPYEVRLARIPEVTHGETTVEMIQAYL